MEDLKTLLLVAIILALTWWVTKEHYYQQGVDNTMEAATLVVEERLEEAKQNGYKEGSAYGLMFLQEVCTQGVAFKISPELPPFYCIPEELLEILSEPTSTPSLLPRFQTTEY